MTDQGPEHLDPRTIHCRHVRQPMRRRVPAISVRCVDVVAIFQAPEKSVQIAAIRVVMELRHPALADARAEQSWFVRISHRCALCRVTHNYAALVRRVKTAI